jgi:hypothetical protein
MNNLNSILVDGTVVGIGQLFGNATETAIVFFLESKRAFRLDGTTTVEAYQFEIHATGKLSQTVAEHLKRGQGARIVGSLRQRPNSAECFIMAAHVEFKPVYKS